MADETTYSVSLLFVLLSILSINGEPAPRVVALTTSSVILEFNTENWPASTYYVEYSEIPVSRYTKGVQVDANPENTVDRISQVGLRPGAHYQMRIVPMINDIRGIPSDIIQVTIPQPAMLAPPVIVILTTSSVTVEFQAANGSVDGYQIEESENPVSFYSSHRMIKAHLGLTVYRLSHSPLRPGGSYQIRIVPLVGEEDHRGIPSPPVTAIIPRPVIVDPPRINLISPTSITAQFFQSNGTSTHYLVQYKPGAYDEGLYMDGARVKDEGHGAATPYTAQQDGLLPDTGYILRIMSIVHYYDRDFNGAPSPIVRFTTPGKDYTPGPATFVPDRTTHLPPEPATTLVSNPASLHGAVVTALVGVSCFLGGCVITGIIFVSWKRCRTKERAKYDNPGPPDPPIASNSHTYEELHLGTGPKRQAIMNEQALPPIPASETENSQNTNKITEDPDSDYIDVI